MDSSSYEVLELGGDQGVSGVCALSWLPEVGPSPDVAAVGWLEPDLGALVVGDFFLLFGF